MPSFGADIRDEWHLLKDDSPGRRFQNHRERMLHGSRVLAMVRAVVGIVLLAAGVVLLFIPGPGLLVIVFGLALLAGMSASLARVMDRAEPAIRHGAHRSKERWAARSTAGKSALVAVVVAGVLLAAYAMARYWFG